MFQSTKELQEGFKKNQRGSRRTGRGMIPKGPNPNPAVPFAPSALKILKETESPPGSTS